MGSTTWLPRTMLRAPRQWLLANGEIVNEPALEETASGLKVRIAGTTRSDYIRYEETLLLREIGHIAAEKQTSVWMSLAGRAEAMNNAAGFRPEETPAELHVLKKLLNARTVAWWRFKHPTLPIEALITIESARTRVVATSPHHVTTSLVTPQQVDSTQSNARFDKAQALTFARAPKAWDPQEVLGQEECHTYQQVVEALLRKVRQVDEMETLEILDLRNPNEPDWLELELDETNVNGTFLSDLTEFLETTSTVEDALRIYKELQECLRGIGVVMEDKTESDFQKGLIGDDPSGVTVAVTSAHEDREHTLRMHLPTGTFVVDCSARVNFNAVADRWEEARTIAALSGEEDTLLAFAREAAARGHKRRTRKIVRGRQGAR